MTVLATLNRWMLKAAQRAEVLGAVVVLAIVFIFIVPLPTWLVDILIALNICISCLLIVLALYLPGPLAFSSFPSILLLTTMFRLALSIATTRLILLEQDAGDIVEAFGNFVVGGNLAVGLVIFMILTLVNFLVITKGSERVAEVAARFSLDAMPGKQMSIDSDLRAGLIDGVQARDKRDQLSRESQLFGAMDGAMKFVKGDAIAGLVILAVNLLGGMLIGMIERDMPFGVAVHTYSLLTVGDGLIAQIPALLISVAAGTVVTRVNSDGEAGDLGSEIIKQLGASYRALGLTALIMIGVSLLPGFPTWVFLGLSAAFGGAAFVMYRRHTRQPQGELETLVETPEPLVEAQAELDDNLLPETRVLLTLGSGVSQSAPRQLLRQRVEALCHELRTDLGVDVPVPGIYMEAKATPGSYRVSLEGVPVSEGELPINCLLLQDDPVHVQLLDLSLIHI